MKLMKIVYYVNIIILIIQTIIIYIYNKDLLLLLIMILALIAQVISVNAVEKIGVKLTKQKVKNLYYAVKQMVMEEQIKNH